MQDDAASRINCLPADPTYSPLRFLDWQPIYTTEHPFVYTLPLQPGVPDTNVVLRTYTDIPIHDVRGRELEFSLDHHGFTYVRDEALRGFDNFESKQAIENEVLPAMKSLVKRVVEDAEGVFCFDWRVSKIVYTS